MSVVTKRRNIERLRLLSQNYEETENGKSFRKQVLALASSQIWGRLLCMQKHIDSAVSAEQHDCINQFHKCQGLQLHVNTQELSSQTDTRTRSQEIIPLHAYLSRDG